MGCCEFGSDVPKCRTFGYSPYVFTNQVQKVLDDMNQRFELQEIVETARKTGIPLSQEEEAAVLELAAEIIPPTLANGPVPRGPVARGVRRSDLGRPSSDSDPLNAIARWTEVAPEDASGALAGVRVTVKDSIAVATIPLQAGSPVLDRFVPDRDATVVRTLLEAGAEIVAITNMDDLAYSGAGNTSVNGPILNPFDTTRVAGGSSSGAAASLYYPGIDAAIGTDQGGSIRLPAAWTNSYGLKPSFGLVSYSGIVGLDATVDHVGPLCRDLRMLARIMDVIAVPDADDPRQFGRPEAKNDYLTMVDSAAEDLRGVRMAVPSFVSQWEIDTDPAIREAFEVFLDRVRGAGATLVDVDIPEHVHAGLLNNAIHMEGTHANMSGGGNPYQHTGGYWPELSAALEDGMRRRSGDLSLHLKAQLVIGRWFQERYRGEIYARAQSMRAPLAESYERALRAADAILMPTSSRMPYPVEHDHGPADFVLAGWRHLAYTSPSDVTGHPAISMPVAEAGGLPIGMMAVGRRFCDSELLGIARRVEHALGRAEIRPAFSGGEAAR